MLSLGTSITAVQRLTNTGPLPPSASIAGLTNNPTYGQTAQIGVELTGVVANGTASAHAWTLDGVAISGATSVTYTPVAGDDEGVLRYAPTVNAATITSDPYTVRYSPPVAGSLTPVNETQGSGTPTVNVAAGFTGSDLTYTEAVAWASITGSTLTINDEVRTDTVIITATNSGGSADVDLSVTITAAPVAGITGLTSNPTHGDTAQIGVQLTGTVTNGTASAHSWTLDGTPISGATASTYTPVAGDDLGALRYAPTVNSQTVTSDPETVRYAPPVGGSLTAVNTTQGGGAPTVNVSAGFTGSDLTYSEAVAWASISGSTLTIDDVVRTDTVTITASNSGGSDTVDLSVTITAASSSDPTITPISLTATAGTTTDVAVAVEESSSYIFGISGSTAQNTPVADPTITGASASTLIDEQLITQFDAVSFLYFETGPGVTSVTINANWNYRAFYHLVKVTDFDPAATSTYDVYFRENNYQGVEEVINVGVDDVLFYVSIVKESGAAYRTPGPDWAASSADFFDARQFFYASTFTEKVTTANATFGAGHNATVAGERDAAGIIHIKA